MLGRLLLLFLLTPAVELGLLIQVDKLIGFWPTIGVIVATGIAGSYLARREGVQTWRRLNERLSRGDLPGTELMDGVIILVAGALLVTPGVLTDAFGFLGLLPPTRALIRKVLMRRFQSKMQEGSMQIQFGIFGGAAPGPNGSAPNGPSGSNQTWKGTSQQVPRHSQDTSRKTDGASDDPFTADRSDER
ncbi:hypothetical protein BSZ35_01455 [Salinibacter sp. 10B]|uniref:FxsA family protein n=1 Tax=Salinibacter sp. 10B TaxID=1923971 RepID=UPI000CF540D4|nr:FxsA family protein [Salinibacter sp. 10B]PQJ33437.1 hypothetical protein BSZ35_01455 [Salinibacter sp. 10B]